MTILHTTFQEVVQEHERRLKSTQQLIAWALRYRERSHVRNNADQPEYIELNEILDAKYWRPETAQEIAQREKSDAEYEAKEEARERERYEALKKKFEP